jgi:rhodanese-related sulfurtransferase
MKELSANELKDLVLIDVREDWEVKVANIDNSLHIPISDIQHRMDDFEANQPLAFICHHGIRSRMVGNYFEENSFTNIFNLKNGIDGWSKEVDKNVPTY